jgi:1,2-phenylacetyl-CoA epoxidase PaaB subunit
MAASRSARCATLPIRTTLGGRHGSAAAVETCQILTWLIGQVRTREPQFEISFLNIWPKQWADRPIAAAGQMGHPAGPTARSWAYKICRLRLTRTTWFFYINSNKPFGRRSAEAAICLTAFDLHFLSKPESFLDVSVMIGLAAGCISSALQNARDRLGRVPPRVQSWVVQSVGVSNVLEPKHREAVLEEEPRDPRDTAATESRRHDEKSRRTGPLALPLSVRA